MPGPGAYTQQASESKNGFIVNSRYKSSAKAVISRGKSRFDNTSMRTSAAIPGPGLYNLKLDLNVKGNYSFARYRNSGAPVFTKGKRDTNLDTSVTRKRKNCSTNFLKYSDPWPWKLSHAEWLRILQYKCINFEQSPNYQARSLITSLIKSSSLHV